MYRFAFVVAACLPATALADAPMVLTHSGRLIGVDGAPIPGPVKLTVTLYGEDDPASGFWTKNYLNQPLDSGYYSVSLVLDDGGEGLDPADFDDGAVWVGLAVDDVAMGERQRLGAVPYALAAGTAGTATGGVTIPSTSGEQCLRLVTSTEYQPMFTPVDCDTGVPIALPVVHNYVTGDRVFSHGSGPLASCKAYVEHAEYSATLNGDGLYRVDPDGSGPNEPLDVFCDMTTDGGGWTFVAFYDATSVNSTAFFEQDIGVYSNRREDAGTVYSIGGSFMSQVPHTQMMVTEDTPDPVAADVANKLVVYEYTAGHSGFTTGPRPCTGLTGFAYRTTLSGPFTSGAGTNSCSTHWYPVAVHGTTQYLSLIHASAAGMYWGSAMGGPNGWGHNGWFYVR